MQNNTWNFREIIPLFVQYCSFLALLIFLIPQEYALFGKIGWWTLVFLLFIRPLADIFPKGSVFAQILFLRKGLGIFSGAFMLAHSIGFFLSKDLPVFTSLINPKYWNMSNLFGWGMLAAAITIPLLLTSNKWSMRRFGKNWKLLQRLSYLIFLFAAIHIAFATESLFSLVIVVLWSVCWVLAEISRRKKRQNPVSEE